MLLLSVFGLYENDLRQLGLLMLTEGEADYESALWNPRHLFWDSLLGHSVFPKLVESLVRDSPGFWQSREVNTSPLCSTLTGSLGGHAPFWSPEGCPWALPSLYYLGPACENLLGKNPRAW